MLQICNFDFKGTFYYQYQSITDDSGIFYDTCI